MKRNFLICLKDKMKYICLVFGFAAVLAGCTGIRKDDGTKDRMVPVTDAGTVIVGNTLEVGDFDERMTLLDNKDALAAEGLYYATWAMGEPQPYENSEGDTVDLYDVQLYLLLSESKEQKTAQENMEKWLAAAKANYEVLKEEELTYHGKTYTLISYQCVNEDNPYARGISAFCTTGNSAFCAELTCMESFNEDLNGLMADFLENCNWSE